MTRQSETMGLYICNLQEKPCSLRRMSVIVINSNSGFTISQIYQKLYNMVNTDKISLWFTITRGGKKGRNKSPQSSKSI